MIFNSNGTSRGFTLIELLVVIAIIGMLASIILVSLNSTREKARDAQRKSAFKQLQLALELYYDSNNNAYPFTGIWYSSEPSDVIPDNGGDYIPGLAPIYISALPRDPLGGASHINPPCVAPWKRAFLYQSIDGTGYTLLSHCAPEGTWGSSDVFYDPTRPTWAWRICSDRGGATCN